MDRVECPNCKTSYTPDRLGLDPFINAEVSATILCAICQFPFDFVQTIETTTKKYWYTFWRTDIKTSLVQNVKPREVPLDKAKAK